MVLVAASLGLILYSVAGISGPESADRRAHGADLPDPVQRRVDAAAGPHRRRQPDHGSVARHADLARQVAEFGRRSQPSRAAWSRPIRQLRPLHAVVNEISELGGLVKQLATSVASHEDLLAAMQANAAAAPEPARKRQKTTDRDRTAQEAAGPHDRAARRRRSRGAAAPAAATGESAPSAARASSSPPCETRRGERIDIFLQPMVTLPQRKVLTTRR